MKKWFARGLASLLGLIAAMWVFGPYEPVDTDISFEPESLPEDLDDYLARAEAAVSGIVDGTQKRIIWAGDVGAQTDVAVVYIHGFSATSEEIRPVPDRVAKALGANLYYARLTGHGRDGNAMAQATAGDWLEDTAEAYAIGRRIGREVIVISTSTGGTLAATLAVDPAASDGVKGLVFVSPNFKLANPAGALLSFPAARQWVPLLVGEDRAFEPVNPAHEQFWTNAYPTTAVLPMAALVKYRAGLDMSSAATPALFMFSDADQVVSASVTRRVAEEWGGPATVAPVVLAQGDDPYNHVIAGDILSPGTTNSAVETIVDWARQLP